MFAIEILLGHPIKLKEKLIDLETKNSNLENLVEELKHKHHQFEAKNERLLKVGFRVLSATFSERFDSTNCRLSNRT